MRRFASAGAAGMAAALLALVPAASAFDAGTTILLSRPAGFGPLPFDGVNSSGTGERALSDDGRYVVFASDSDGLSSQDDDTVTNVFRRDRVTGQTVLVSRATGAAGRPVHADAFVPVSSRNGNVVAFVTTDALDPADTNGKQDVYVRDLTAGTTVLASRATGGAVGNADSTFPSLDQDGSAVAFVSSATNLDANDVNGFSDVFLRDIAAGTTTLESRPTGASAKNTGQGPSFFSPSLDGSGTKVAFDTGAALDSLADTNGLRDVYVRSGSTTILVSRIGNASSHASDGFSSAPSISADGTKVAFESTGTNFDASDQNGSVRDVFVRDLSLNNSTSLVSRKNGPGNVSGAGSSDQAAISGDGTRVAFNYDGTDLGDGDTNALTDVHVRDISSGTTTWVSRADGPAGPPGDGMSFAPSLSGDGSVGAFMSDAGNLSPGSGPDFTQVYVRSGSTTELASGPTGPATEPFRSGATHSFVADSGGSSVSADGRFVAISSFSNDFSTLDDDRFGHCFRREVQTGDVLLLDRAPNGGPSDGDCWSAVLSADGRRAAFISTADNLVAGGVPAGSQHVFVVDIASGTTWLADRASGDGGAVGDNLAGGPALDADGGRVAFWSQAQNLDAAAATGQHVYLRDVRTAVTTVVDRRDGASGAVGDSDAAEPSISADGQRVAFHSWADDLGDGDTNSFADVHVRDLASGQTIWASRPDSGSAQSDGVSGHPSLSGDGTRVAFVSGATNLGDGDTDSAWDTHLRDLATGRTSLVSRADGSGTKADGDSQRSWISQDGSKIVFIAAATNLDPAATTPGVREVYLRDVASGTTRLVSRADGAGGSAAPDWSDDAGLSADGGCVAFDTTGSGLEPGGYPSGDFMQVHLRTVSGTCPVPGPAPNGGPGPGPGSGGPGPGPGSPKPGPGRDSVAPVVSGLRLSATRFAVGGRPTAVSARAKRGARRRVARGTTVRFRLSEAATVTFAFSRPVKGRRVGKRCVKATAKLRRRRACSRTETFGTLTRRAGAGASKLAFTGRVGRRALPRGRWKLTVVARDAAGNRSASRSLAFTVVRG